MRLVRIGLVLSLASLVGEVARAASPDAAPPQSRAQVQAALRALEHAFESRARRLPAGAEGTIEHAVAGYAPGTFRAVDEGAIAPRRPNGGCPPEMARVDGRFCIDRYEASLVQSVDGSLEAWSPFTPPPGDHAVFARSVPAVVPQAYISAAQAAQACAAVGKRLCQPVEWRAACGGSQGYAYPYGPRRIPGRCHDAGVAPMRVFHAAERKKGWGPLELNDPRLNQLDGTVAKTGAFADCVNDYGVYDMVGNLHEWTADPNGTFQGGFCLDIDQHGEGCAYRTIAHEYTYHDYSTGFRCCASLREPDSAK
ncbi:MAG: SUMF1/EgtB/PvdO family nonheme iron enzyme [Myxococcota bacterium]|nr:SUMF1/EgtB/PvdO family nonheme iron enzyme [Myxococcota bacterium]